MKKKLLTITKSTNTDNANGTSFHGDTLLTSYSHLVQTLGEPSYYENTGTDKVNIDFTMCLGTDTFTIYDYKYYRVIEPTEIITWHIGAHSKIISNKVHNILKQLL
jgi:hypothetical protein